MILRYKRDDGTVEDYEFHPGRLLNPEAEAIEDVGGSAWETFDEWGEKFMKGNRRAYRAALWIVQKRKNPPLKFNDVSFTVDSFTWDFDEEEKAKIKAEIREAASGELDAEQRKTLLEILNETPGKESGNPSENSDGSTDSESANVSTQA